MEIGRFRAIIYGVYQEHSIIWLYAGLLRCNQRNSNLGRCKPHRCWSHTCSEDIRTAWQSSGAGITSSYWNGAEILPVLTRNTWGILGDNALHLYVYGSEFKVITHHRPLEPLFNRALSKPPTRIEIWILRLQAYHFLVEYRSGKQNRADYLSRHPLHPAVKTSREVYFTQEYVNFLVGGAIPKALALEEIIAATEADVVIELCCKSIETEKWHEHLTYAKSLGMNTFESLIALF